MTDRDTFAAAALAGLMANPKNNDTTADTIRFWAWNWADAMLRERGRFPARMEFPAPSDAVQDSPGDGWRWVEQGKPVMEGDEYLSSVSNVWCPSYWRDAAPYRTYRRRIKSHANHDAAPAARAQLPTGDHASGGSGSVGTDNADPLTRLGTGDTQEPVAWGVATSRGVIATSISRIDAVDMQSDYACDTEVVPLYRSPTLNATPPSHATHGECSAPPECTQPTLTDEEREAIEEHLLTLDETARNLALMSEPQDEALIFYRKNAATLRGLLERTK